MELSKLLDYKDDIMKTISDVGSTLSELDYESAFGKLYSIAPTEDQLNLSYLYDSIISANSTVSTLGLENPAYQFFNLTEQLCSISSGFAVLQITRDLVDKIKEAATQAADKTKWNVETSEYDELWDIEDIVNSFFPDSIPTLTGEQSGLVTKMINSTNNEQQLDQDIDHQLTI